VKVVLEEMLEATTMRIGAKLVVLESLVFRLTAIATYDYFVFWQQHSCFMCRIMPYNLVKTDEFPFGQAWPDGGISFSLCSI